MLLGCTSVVNLFHQTGEPVRLTHTAASYAVTADGRRAFAHEVHSIDSVKMVRQTPQGESVVEFSPFYSLRHAQTPERNGHYWVARRDEVAGERSPGFETEISIVDIDFDPAAIEVGCTAAATSLPPRCCCPPAPGCPGWPAARA